MKGGLAGGGGGPTGPGKKMFVTSIPHNPGSIAAGGFVNVIGADNQCNIDAGTVSVYKALIVDGAIRIACTTTNCGGGIIEHSDWVLGSNQLYVQSDGVTQIGVTNANGIFTTNLTNSVTAGASKYWTGISTAGNDWNWLADTINCNNWTDGTAGFTGSNGISPATDFTAISLPFASGGNLPCSNTANAGLLCVEQ